MALLGAGMRTSRATPSARSKLTRTLKGPEGLSQPAAATQLGEGHVRVATCPAALQRKQRGAARQLRARLNCPLAAATRTQQEEPAHLPVRRSSSHSCQPQRDILLCVWTFSNGLAVGVWPDVWPKVLLVLHSNPHSPSLALFGVSRIDGCATLRVSHELTQGFGNANLTPAARSHALTPMACKTARPQSVLLSCVADIHTP